MNTSTSVGPLSPAPNTPDLIASVENTPADDAAGDDDSPKPADDDQGDDTPADPPAPDAEPAPPAPPEPLAPPEQPAPPPARLASPRTQARVPAKRAAKPGARKPRKAAAEAEAEAGEVYAIVLQTSKILGPTGRAIARRTAVLAPGARADGLIRSGQARPATEAEAASAVIVID